MKHPNHYCVRCDEEVSLTIREAKTYSMYHCRQCGEEICRVDDLPRKGVLRQVKGGLDFKSLPAGVGMHERDESIVNDHPEMLSDEHKLWPDRDADEEWQRHQNSVDFMLDFNQLTPRQKQIVFAVGKYRSHGKAAKDLGISQQAVSDAIKEIRKKLS